MSETVNNDLNSNDSKTLVIGSGIRMEGKIDGALNSDISGSYNGKIKSESINISETGVFVGDISGGDINISGKVEGTIISDDLLSVHPTAVVNETIEYTLLELATVQDFKEKSNTKVLFNLLINQKKIHLMKK